MKLKVDNKEIDCTLQGHGKTSFKDQMYLIFVTFITMEDSVTIYHTVASGHSSKMFQYFRKVG